MARISIAETQDVDDQAQALNGFRQVYQQLGRGRFHGVVWQLVMDEGYLLRESANCGLRQQFTPPPQHLAIAMPLAARPGSLFAGQALQPRSLMLLGPQEEYDLLSAGDIDVIGLCVHQDLVARTLAPAEQDWLRRATAQQHLALSPPTAAALREMLLGMAEQGARHLAAQPAAGPAAALDTSPAPPPAAQAAQPTSSAERDLLAAALSQAVWLGMADAGVPLQAQLPRRLQARRKVLQRAVAYLHAHLHEEVGVEALCAAACASRRSLQYCFEELLHSTPQAYLRSLRLNAARRALKRADAPPIAELAGSLRFAGASHFTRHYKLLFDELPSATRQRASLQPRGLAVPAP